MACSAGGPMEITILDVDEEDSQCNDCGKKFKRLRKKARCPDCQSENVSPLEALENFPFFLFSNRLVSTSFGGYRKRRL